jgi:hypothetical protein
MGGGVGGIAPAFGPLSHMPVRVKRSEYWPETVIETLLNEAKTILRLLTDRL